MNAAAAVQKELLSIPEFNAEEGFLMKEHQLVSNFKKVILITAGAAAQKCMMQLESEQEILMHIADMIIYTYAAESALMHTLKLKDTLGEQSISLYKDITQTYLYDAADKIHKHAKDAINAFAEGDEQRMLLLGVKRFTKTDPFNTKRARRSIAEKLIQEKKYCFEISPV